MPYLFATGNKGKIRYYSRKLKERGIDFVTPKEIGVSVDVEENGATPGENALIKARAYAKATGMITIAEDDGLYLEGLPEELQPGTHVKRVGGRELNADEMIDYYRELVRTYGENGAMEGYYLKGVAVVCGDREYSFECKDYRHFVDQVSDVYDPGLPLASIQIVEPFGKFKSELTEEEERTTLDVARKPIFDFLRMTLAEIEEKLIYQGTISSMAKQVVHIESDEALGKLLKDRGGAYHLADFLRTEHQKRYQEVMKINRASLAIEILMHYQLLIFARNYEKRHGKHKFTQWLIGHAIVIDCGEFKQDNNRWIWDIMALFVKKNQYLR